MAVSPDSGTGNISFMAALGNLIRIDVFLEPVAGKDGGLAQRGGQLGERLVKLRARDARRQHRRDALGDGRVVRLVVRRLVDRIGIARGLRRGTHVGGGLGGVDG